MVKPISISLRLLSIYFQNYELASGGGPEVGTIDGIPEQGHSWWLCCSVSKLGQ